VYKTWYKIIRDGDLLTSAWNASAPTIMFDYSQDEMQFLADLSNNSFVSNYTMTSTSVVAVSPYGSSIHQ
jgi:hypothetical protein